MIWMTFTVNSIIEGSALAIEMQKYATQPAFYQRFLDPTVAFFASTDIDRDAEHFYFTPSAVPIFRPFIDTYGGRECAAPKRGAEHDRGISLMMGDHRAWDLIEREGAH